MATIRDNEFTIKCSEPLIIDYIDGSAVVSEGQPMKPPPNLQSVTPTEYKITFKAGRNKTKSVAEAFKSKTGSSAYSMYASGEGNSTPNELNFFFGLTITPGSGKDNDIQPITLYLGQGSNAFRNNWWIGSEALAHFNDAYLLATQNGQVAWRCKLSMSTSSVEIIPIYANKPSGFGLLDVWGEGRIITDEGEISGFQNSLNLNLYSQEISNGPQDGQAIPQQVTVYDYYIFRFPVATGAVEFITMMGAPMYELTAQEIIRVLNPKKGVVIFWNLDPGFVKIFEDSIISLKSNLKLNSSAVLKYPFNEIKFKEKDDIRVYSSPESKNDVEFDHPL